LKWGDARRAEGLGFAFAAPFVEIGKTLHNRFQIIDKHPIPNYYYV
jgi:hypothetical protein